MAEINVTQVRPDQARESIRDIESNNSADHSQDLKKLQTKKRMRRLAYVTVFVLLQTAVILAFALTILRIRNPRFRIQSVVVENLVTTKSSSPSLGLRLSAEVSVKNSNFGDFRFHESSVEFVYDGDKVVGEASVPDGKAGALSTKKASATAELEIDDESSSLGSDTRLGVLTLKSKGKLSGKVELLKVFKKDKTVEMNCTIVINLASKVVNELKCN